MHIFLLESCGEIMNDREEEAQKDLRVSSSIPCNLFLVMFRRFAFLSAGIKRKY